MDGNEERSGVIEDDVHVPDRLNVTAELGGFHSH